MRGTFKIEAIAHSKVVRGGGIRRSANNRRPLQRSANLAFITQCDCGFRVVMGVSHASKS